APRLIAHRPLSRCVLSTPPNSKKPRRLQRQAQEGAPDHFIDGKLRLRLLRDGVHVAEAALERIAFENRGGAGAEISGLGDLAGLLAQRDRGHAQPHALVERDGTVLRGAPDLVPGGVEKSPRRRKL